MKLQWVMSSQRIPRELPETEADLVEWQLQLEGSDVPVRVTFSAQDYRRLLRDLQAYAEAMVTLDGFLVGAKTGGLMLERVRFRWTGVAGAAQGLIDSTARLGSTGCTVPPARRPAWRPGAPPSQRASIDALHGCPGAKPCSSVSEPERLAAGR
jgi:hypothetical protein